MSPRPSPASSAPSRVRSCSRSVRAERASSRTRASISRRRRPLDYLDVTGSRCSTRAASSRRRTMRSITQRLRPGLRGGVAKLFPFESSLGKDVKIGGRLLHRRRHARLPRVPRTATTRPRRASRSPARSSCRTRVIPLSTLYERFGDVRSRSGEPAAATWRRSSSTRSSSRSVDAAENVTDRSPRTPPAQMLDRNHDRIGRLRSRRTPRAPPPAPRRPSASSTSSSARSPGISLLVGGIGIMNVMLANGDRAHARDRHPPRPRRETPPHRHAVPRRNGRPLGRRRPGRRRARRCDPPPWSSASPT